MLSAGWEVRIVKICGRRVLKMLPEAAGLGKHFQDLGHSFSLIRTSQPANIGTSLET